MLQGMHFSFYLQTDYSSEVQQDSGGHLHNPGDWVLHEKQVECMTTVCSEVLPAATHFTLPGNGATKILISVAPATLGIHSWQAAHLQK
jgi:hypothetical protein